MGTGQRKERQAGALSPLLISFELCRTSLSLSCTLLLSLHALNTIFFFYKFAIAICHSAFVSLRLHFALTPLLFMQCIKYGLAKIQLSHLETRQDGKAATSGNTTIGDLNFAGPVSLYTLCCGNPCGNKHAELCCRQLGCTEPLSCTSPDPGRCV